VSKTGVVVVVVEIHCNMMICMLYVEGVEEFNFEEQHKID
jgi:hypothetical protein